MALPTLVTRHRLARLGSYVSTQLLVQGIGFVAALVVVRHMAQVEYGYYTLALSVAGVAVCLGDLGLSTAVLASGGRLDREPRTLGALVGDAHALQLRMAWLSAAVLVPCCVALLLRQQASHWQALGLTALVVLAAALSVRAGIATSVARLLGHIGLQQKLELGLNIGKLVLLLLAAWLTLDAAVACAVNLAAAAVGVALLHRYLGGQAPQPAKASGLHRAALLRQVMRQAPNSIYFVFSSQAAVWLIGIFGSAERVAEVGALGRLGALFALVGAVSAALVLPYFARRQSRAEIGAGLVFVNAFFAALLAGLLALAFFAPSTLLWLLGASYAGLHTELAWMLAAGTLAAWGGTLYSVGCARGWVTPFWLVAPIGLLATVAAALSVDVATVRGSYIINAATALAGTALALGYLFVQLRRHP